MSTSDEYNGPMLTPVSDMLRRNMDMLEENKPDTLWSKIYVTGQNGLLYPHAGALGGFGITAISNMLASRPLFAKFPVMALAMAAGALIGGRIDYWRTKFNAERDGMMHHYISLHPEDFQEEVPPKLKYVLYPWNPRRESWDALKGYPLR